jgi:hypothetical protein
MIDAIGACGGSEIPSTRRESGGLLEQNHTRFMLASVPLIPKFASDCNDVRSNRDTSLANDTQSVMVREISELPMSQPIVHRFSWL